MKVEPVALEFDDTSGTSRQVKGTPEALIALYDAMIQKTDVKCRLLGADSHGNTEPPAGG